MVDSAEKSKSLKLDGESVLFAPKKLISKKLEVDRYLILDPDRPYWVTLDEFGKRVVEMFDGKRTVNDIARHFSGGSGGSLEEMQKRLLPFIARIADSGFITGEPIPYPERPVRKPERIVELWISITDACNLKCIHCHTESCKPLAGELERGDFLRVIDDYGSQKGIKLVLTGGEPLLKSGIAVDVIKRAMEQGINDILLITNGTPINSTIARDLAGLPVVVQMSLDGSTAETNDMIRGKGAYEAAMRGFRHLLDAGAQCWLSMTVMKANAHQVTEMARLSKELGRDRVHYPFLQIKGRAERNRDFLFMSCDEYLEVLKRIYSIPGEVGIRVTVEESFVKSVRTGARRDFCRAGTALLSMSADGGVYPCMGLHEPEFLAGNVRDNGLIDIFKNSDILQRFGPMSVMDIPECADCSVRFVCGGGCHIDTYYEHGCLGRPTPKCKMMHDAYWTVLEKIARESFDGNQ